MRNLEEPEDYSNCFSLHTIRLDSATIGKLMLLCGNNIFDNEIDDVYEITESIDIIRPGDIINVYDGVTVRVKEDFVDPRTTEEFKDKTAKRRKIMCDK